ncbi:MAG: TolC family protein [Deltaproteobacteria bacterium]|nr:TolC family protein [Deltaproteobacteria bacterium]
MSGFSDAIVSYEDSRLSKLWEMAVMIILFSNFQRHFRTPLVLLLTAVLFLLTGFGREASAEEANHVFTLKESVAIALERSLKLDSAVQSVKGAKWKKSETQKKFLPQFETSYSWTRLDSAPTFSGFVTGTEDNWQLKLTMNQPLFTGFALKSGYELAKLGIDIAEISLGQTRLDLILEVKQVYFNILRAQKATEVAIQAVKQREAHLNVALNFYEVGMIPKNQVLQAEVLLAEAIQERTKAENAVMITKASFNTILRRSLESPVEIEDILIYKPFPHDFTYCLERALEKRPEIKALLKQVKVGEQKVRLAKADYYPSLALQANHYWKGDTWQINGSSFMDDPTSWDVTAVLSWNIWSWGQTLDQVRFNRTELAKIHNAVIEAKDGISLEVKSSYLNMKEAEKNIFVARKAVEQGEENYRMSQERYREQVATATEVTDAETLLTAARRNYYDTLYNYNLAWAALERAMGLGRDEI